MRNYMNHSSNCDNRTERPCGLAAFLPLGMSCRGRAEAFARSLQSRLRTLGTQSNESTPITNNSDHDNTWLSSNAYTQPSSNVTNNQPVSSGTGLNDLTDSYFDFDIPGSPNDENEYAHLIDTPGTLTVTSQGNASESGYVCASPTSSASNNITNDYSDTSSTDEPFFDPESSDNEVRSLSLSAEYYDCDDTKKDQQLKIFEQRQQQQQLQHHHLHHQEQQEQPNIDTSDHTESQSTNSPCTLSTSESNALNVSEVDEVDSCPASLQSLSNASSDPFDTENDVQPVHIDIDIKLERTNSISTNDETIQLLADVQEIPKYDPSTVKDTLTVDHFANGISSEEEEEVPLKERFRRSSSLKTGKTPPGTPGRKKIVRFADVLGLDLADVRTFLDEIPRVPKSAFDELIVPAAEPPISLGQRLDKIIVPLFQQPGASPNFLDVVQSKNVALENAAVTDPICLTITGLVRVRNLDFNKSVHIRYTLDAWQSYSDLQAQYVPSSCDGFSDKFSFTVFGNSMAIGQRIEIAIRFSCKGEQFWDNNHGINYCFQCMPATTPQLQTTNTGPTGNDVSNQHAHLSDSWCGSSFY